MKGLSSALLVVVLLSGSANADFFGDVGNWITNAADSTWKVTKEILIRSAI